MPTQKSSSDWNIHRTGRGGNVNGKELIIQVVDLRTVSVDDVVSAINGNITGFSAENEAHRIRTDFWTLQQLLSVRHLILPLPGIMEVPLT